MPTVVVSAQESPDDTSLMFSEVKIRHDTNNATDHGEFIEIYNAGALPIELGTYSVAYFNVTTPESGRIPVLFAFPEGHLAAYSSVVFARDTTQISDSLPLGISSLADNGGRLQLLDSEAVVVDEIAWTNVAGSALPDNVMAPIMYVCTNTAASCQSRAQSLQYDHDSAIWVMAAPDPGSSILIPPEIPTPKEDEVIDEPDDVLVPIEEEVNIGCDTVIISELLPNPAGSDVGNEFIELHNSKLDSVMLEGCALQTTGSSKVYDLTGMVIAGGAYVLLSNSTTGLTLPNAAGGTVWLLEGEIEVQTVLYEPDIDDDVSWVWHGGLWQLSYKITPGLINEVLSEKPCESGYVRDELTRACEVVVVKVATASSLIPCRSDQVRNPATNRCRTIVASATPALSPCRSDQERNPETNRCRTIQRVSALTPCSTGEERNPETNRCRQVLSATSDVLPPVQDVVAPVASNMPRLAVLISVGMLVLGYGVYEWRRDIALAGGRFTHRVTDILRHK